MSSDSDGDKGGIVITWIITIIITTWIGFSWGANSKQPTIDSQQAKISSLTDQVSTLTAQLNSAESDNTTTVPKSSLNIAPTQTPTECAVTTCNDGSCSFSTGRGTCSWHGGIAY